MAVVVIILLAVLIIVRRPRQEPPSEPQRQAELDSFIRQAERMEDSLVRHKPYYRQSQSYHHNTRYEEEQHLQPADTEGFHPYQPKEFLVFNLNDADTTDLKQLNGIGSTFAKRIVKYRDLLGGYVNKEQLKEVYGMTPELYAKILPHLNIGQGTIRLLSLNSSPLDSLKRHPYLDYQQAKAIVTYRQKGGTFRSANDLLKVNLFDQKTIDKIAPYLKEGKTE